MKKQDVAVQQVRIGGRAYRVRTQIVVEEVDSEDGQDGGEARQVPDGGFEMMLSEDDACSIDKSEQAILGTCWPAMREALSQHLNAVSKKKAEKELSCHGGQVIDDPTAYRVDGEVGRLTFTCHQVERNGSVLFDTSRELFPALIGKQWYRTVGFKELAVERGALDRSYRQAARMVNRIRHQPEATPLRTLQDSVEAEGLAAAEALEQEAKCVVRQGGMDAETLQPTQQRETCTRQHLDPTVVDAALREVAPDIKTLDAMRANPIGYEDPRVTVNVSIDDVLAKKQREHRRAKGRGAAAQEPEEPTGGADSASKEKKRVHTTVAHVQTQAGSRIYATSAVASTCLFVLAFLTANRLLTWNWMFFVDGQRSLHDILLRLFAWQGTLQLILDWHHIDKKCQEMLSRAMNNRHARNEVLKELLALLWYGDIDAAIEHLSQVDATHVKSLEALEKLAGYFERNRQCIPCYAARKKLGLRNSSNIGEKSNDLVVSDRQKHNGMSWSQDGSSALSTLLSLVRNDNHGEWFESNTVSFRLAA